MKQKLKIRKTKEQNKRNNAYCTGGNNYCVDNISNSVN